MLVKIINTILENTYTTDELAERLGLMRIYYGAHLFKSDEGAKLDLRHTLVDQECGEHTLAALDTWDVEFKKAHVPERTVYEALDTIEQELTTMPSVVLYLPIRFSPEYIAGFGKWFRSEVSPNLLLSVRTDAAVAGGCALVWNDHYHNFSLKYFIRKQKKEVIAMFNRHTQSHVH